MPTPSAPQSFIPHEAAVAAQSVRKSGKGLTDLFALISLVLFVAAIALAVGMFLYNEYLSASAESKVDQLERAKAAFEPSLIAELTRLDDRMQAAGAILQKHIAPSVFFQMLEQTTIGSVAFSSLDFEVTDTESMAIQMDGIAGSVNGIALQADLLSKGGMVASPIFSNINREVDGVHFSLSANVNPVAINFSQLISAGASGVPSPTEQTLPFGLPAQAGAPAGEQTEGAALQDETGI